MLSLAGEIVYDEKLLAEIYQQHDLLRRIRRPSTEHWKMVNELKCVLKINRILDWKWLIFTIQELITRSKKAILIRQQGFVVGGKVLYARKHLAVITKINLNFSISIHFSGSVPPHCRSTITISPNSLDKI